ncbi:carboxylesterase family protein [Lentzea tibetensis]|uniref:Carboxylic ester hydrolase n=1 Tax=Lentzea tibetensis TaxID=2591470 RepID=A0A563EF57_9PSEU|nr:carboxylesterase family protein [Lentzea tibetensis]TWP44048.1 carboxylesterase family protein [Lentzea tibetensis]
MRKIWVGVLLAGLLTGTAQASSGDGAVVRTEAGAVRGTVTSEHRTFQGIPFAAPPVGELRFRSPRPVTPWTDVRDATEPGSRCAQSAGAGTPSTTEDCLYLNVTTPRGTKTSSAKKPVMVWLHGGGNSYGTAADFDAHRLAVGADVVVVTTNYRLGAFGFLGYPGLAGSGTFGIEDQQAALRWVRRNATRFGGDPGNVTIFGESGGAFDVCAQVTSPLSAGLFHRAIAQSGSCSMTWPVHGVIHGSPAGSPWISLRDSQARGVDVATKLGCADVECLRRVPAEALTPHEANANPTAITYGGPALPLHPRQALAQGRFNRVPVLWGNTRDEGRLTAAFGPRPFTEETYRALLTEQFGADAGRIAAEYPSSAHGTPGLAWSAVLTDRVWACGQLADDRLLARRTATYGYEFADRGAPTGFFPFPQDVPGGAFHSSELAYLFDVAGFQAVFTPEQQRLADQMIRAWGRFAATGDPGWARFDGRNVQSLAPGAVRPVDLSEEHHCSFWN